MENKVEITGTATLNVKGKTIELPVYSGTIGPDVIDVRKLYAQAGVFTFDPGFTSTAACESQITYIDGGKGQLLHRGYDIADLAENSTFLEVCYLLLNGDLPTPARFERFQHTITQHTMLHTQMDTFFNGFRRDSHPMAMLTGTVGAMSAFYPKAMDISDAEERGLASIRLIAKMATLAARVYKFTVGQPFVEPDNSLNYAENFMRMCFSVPAEPYIQNDVLTRAMDRILILHADHEQNASTSTVRLAGSSGAHPYAAIAAGVACLWGPAHGGANEAALNMLKEIGSVDRIPEFIARAKDKNDPFRLMGFGHRVYKNYDPRAKVMQQTAHEVLSELGLQNNPIMLVAQELEKIARDDEYFVERQLYPNVDFYSGIILSAMGFPTTMFTVLFSLARTVGWVSQLNEMRSDSSQRIGRPRQSYTGAPLRPYIPLDKRG